MEYLLAITNEAIRKSVFGLFEYTCWDLLPNADVVIEVVAGTDGSLLYTADSGYYYYETIDILDFAFELRRVLR